MSADENTRIAQSAYEAFGRGDIPALAELMAVDIEWVIPGDPYYDPNAGTFNGKEAVMGWFGGLGSTLDFTTFEPREFIAEDDKVVSLVYAEATVRSTGRAVVNHEAHVWTFRDGKLARFQLYQGHRSGGCRPPRGVAPRGTCRRASTERHQRRTQLVRRAYAASHPRQG